MIPAQVPQILGGSGVHHATGEDDGANVTASAASQLSYQVAANKPASTRHENFFFEIKKLLHIHSTCRRHTIGSGD
jgi:hypothetical protein